MPAWRFFLQATVDTSNVHYSMCFLGGFCFYLLLLAFLIDFLLLAVPAARAGGVHQDHEEPGAGGRPPPEGNRSYRQVQPKHHCYRDQHAHATTSRQNLCFVAVLVLRVKSQQTDLHQDCEEVWAGGCTPEATGKPYT